MAGHDELVEVGGLGGIHRLQREVVDEQQPHLGEPAHLGFGAVVEPGCLEPLEHRVGAQHQGGHPAADGDVAERGGQMCFADPDGTQNAGAVGAVEEPQAGQLGPQRPVVADRGGLVPGVEAHAGIEPGGAGPAGSRAGVAAGGLVGQDELEERHVRQMPLAGQGEPLGQCVEHPAQLELAHHPLQVG